MDIKELQRLIQAQNLYVLQDTRSTVGNDLVFHAEDNRGYTTDLSKAHLFTLKEANLRHADRATDQPHRLGDLIMKAGLSVDVQRMAPTHNAQVSQEPEPPTLSLDDEITESDSPGMR